MKYEGDHLNGQTNGIGICYFTDGAIYMGENKIGKKIGYGIYECLESKYEGHYINDTKTGIGIETSHKEGGKYIGNFYSGQFSGFGKLIFADGSYFIGEWKNGEKKKGIWFYNEDKGLFDAVWEYKEDTNQSIGKGTYYFPDGTKQKRIRICKEEGIYGNIWENY